MINKGKESSVDAFAERRKIKRYSKRLVCGAHAGKALGRHGMQWLVFGDLQRILVANQSLCVELEGFAHELGESVEHC